jgi:hypothetical protein
METIDKILEDIEYEIKVLKGKLENPITSPLNKMLIRSKIEGYMECKIMILKRVS